jgi:hypothetical protein
MRRRTGPARAGPGRDTAAGPAVLGITIAGLAAVVVTGALAMLSLAAPAAADSGQVTVQGEIDGLYPGFTGTMQATVSNGFDRPVRVTLLDTKVLDAKPSCPAGMITVSPVTTEFEIASGAVATTPVTVHMDFAAPDACQGATWPLRFAASLVGAGGSGLAGTGFDTGTMVIIGLALLALGGVAVRVARGSRS